MAWLGAALKCILHGKVDIEGEFVRVLRVELDCCIDFRALCKGRTATLCASASKKRSFNLVGYKKTPTFALAIVH